MITRYAMRLCKWMRYASGSSYQHHKQEQGLFFQPGVVDGYYNDLRHKADWTGVFSDGVPVVQTDTDPAFLFPIVIFQWGLGNWDCWLESGREDKARLDNVLATARWASASQTEDGGWECWTGLVRPTISPYSAMAQGEGISLLVRAAQIEEPDRYLETAKRAAGFMLESGRHGLTRDYGGWSSLEEYPGDAFPAVLNGWVFALVGLHELAIVTGDTGFSEQASRFAAHLATACSRYDNGYWSTYDLGGNIASPFYHDLHIAQLRSLAIMFPAHADAFNKIATRFEAYGQKRSNRLRSVATKVAQKLSQPAVGEMA